METTSLKRFRGLELDSTNADDTIPHTCLVEITKSGRSRGPNLNSTKEDDTNPVTCLMEIIIFQSSGGPNFKNNNADDKYASYEKNTFHPPSLYTLLSTHFTENSPF